MTSRLRWLAIAVFALANALNYMDRQILAALAPQIKQEFHISNAGYGDVLSPSPSATRSRRWPDC